MKFKSSEMVANRDRTILFDWEKGYISTEEAAKLLSENNGQPVLTEDQFTRLAARLGYVRW